MPQYENKDGKWVDATPAPPNAASTRADIARGQATVALNNLRVAQEHDEHNVHLTLAVTRFCEARDALDKYLNKEKS